MQAQCGLRGESTLHNLIGEHKQGLCSPVHMHELIPGKILRLGAHLQIVVCGVVDGAGIHVRL
jgi:hypothetical protein